jgi:hypothetical protein
VLKTEEEENENTAIDQSRRGNGNSSFLQRSRHFARNSQNTGRTERPPQQGGRSVCTSHSPTVPRAHPRTTHMVMGGVDNTLGGVVVAMATANVPVLEARGFVRMRR